MNHPLLESIQTVQNLGVMAAIHLPLFTEIYLDRSALPIYLDRSKTSLPAGHSPGSNTYFILYDVPCFKIIKETIQPLSDRQNYPLFSLCGLVSSQVERLGSTH